MPDAHTSSRLQVLQDHAVAAYVMLSNLARTLGAFEGLNNRLRRGMLAGPGAHAIEVVLFDLLHILAIRVNALLISPQRKDDVGLQTFIEALDDAAICEALVERAGDTYHETIYADFNAREKERTRARIVAAKRRFGLLDQAAMGDLRQTRNKFLAHTTTQFTHVPKARIGDLIHLAERVISLGRDIGLLFRGSDRLYWHEVRKARDDAGRIVGLMRAVPAERLRKSYSDKSA